LYRASYGSLIIAFKLKHKLSFYTPHMLLFYPTETLLKQKLHIFPCKNLLPNMTSGS